VPSRNFAAGIRRSCSTSTSGTALGSVATFEKVLYDGEEFGALADRGSAEEWDFIGLPGILEPDQVSELAQGTAAAAGRGTRWTGGRAAAASGGLSREDAAASEPKPLHRTLAEQRKLLNSLVSIRARGSGQTHAMVHAEVRRGNAVVPRSPRATVAQAAVADRLVEGSTFAVSAPSGNGYR